MPHNAFWRRKVSSFGTRFDMDKDGVITAKDFDSVADRYIKMEKSTEEGAKKLRGKINAIWKKYFEEASNVVKVTPDIFTEQLEKLGEAQMLADAREMLTLFFDLIDTNENGYIELREFRVFFKILGIEDESSTALADTSFKMIDTNHDGQLSREEFLACGVEFVTSDDESLESKYFFGPLI